MRRLVAIIALAGAAALAGSGCKKSEAATRESQELFAATCSRCHGADGAGGLPLWEAGPSPQDFRDHAFQRARTDEQLKQTIKNGKGTGMPAFGALLTDEQVAMLVVQVRSFDTEGRR
ncbi:MAG: cytochrome c [Labilithrix sp.]|nr:cytochrome c [Labilithrix sp.]MCW5809853.1 cytochrome c [Labilithrix sp.]